MTVALSGMYHVEARCTWDSNTTGNRLLQINGTGISYTMDGFYQTASAALVGGATQVSTGVIFLAAGAIIKAVAYQTSGSTRQVTNANFKVIRL